MQCKGFPASMPVPDRSVFCKRPRTRLVLNLVGHYSVNYTLTYDISPDERFLDFRFENLGKLTRPTRAVAFPDQSPAHIAISPLERPDCEVTTSLLGKAPEDQRHFHRVPVESLQRFSQNSGTDVAQHCQWNMSSPEWRKAITDISNADTRTARLRHTFVGWTSLLQKRRRRCRAR